MATTACQFQIPVGDAQDFTGVVSVIHPPADPPAEVAAQLEAARERLIEAAAENDDVLADKYLEGETLTDEEILEGVRKAVLTGEVVPVLATSATANLGVAEFLEMVQEFMPSPN